MTGRAQVIRSDARRLPLADDSVDLICSSPPYFALRSYQDGGEHYAGQIGSEPTPAEFVDALVEVTRECVRVLKPSGSLWINLGDKYAGSGGGGEGSSDGMTGRAARPPRRASDIPTKSLMGIPWRYALRCIDTTRTGHLHVEAVREVIDDLAAGEIDQRTAHRRIDALEEAAAKGSAGLGLILRAEVIWSKPNGLPESVTDRVRRSHEQWFHFTLQPRYYSAVDEIRERVDKYNGRSWSDRKALGEGPRQGEQRTETATVLAAHPLGKLPNSVWEIPTEPLTVPSHRVVRNGRTEAWFFSELDAWRYARRTGVRGGRPSIRPEIDHFAAFPTEWPRRIIQGWSPPGICTACGEGRAPTSSTSYVKTRGDSYARGQKGPVPGHHSWEGAPNLSKIVAITGYACACPEPTAPTRPSVVLDPFGGTGTTALAALALGRHGITLDMSADYSRLARWRTTDQRQLAGAMRILKPAVQVDGQASMFDFLEEAAE